MMKYCLVLVFCLISVFCVGQEKQLMVNVGHSANINSVSFSPDGHTIASGAGDGTVRIWEIQTGKLLIILAGHARSISSVSFSPDGRFIASGSHDQTIKLEFFSCREIDQAGTFFGVASVSRKYILPY